MKRLARFVIFYGALLGLWVLLAELKIWPPYLFPTPKGVAEALYAGFADHSFWIAMAVSMRRVLIGYGISVVLGMILGLGVASNKFLEETMGGLLVSLQSLPSICWLPLAVLWFGLTRMPFSSWWSWDRLLSVTIAMEDWAPADAQDLRHGGPQSWRPRFPLFWHVLLPASLPYIVSGLKQGWAFAWRSLISGEMLFVSLGLGQLLMMGRDLNDMSQVIAVMILIIAIGYVVDGLVFKTMERRLQRRWGLVSAS